MTEAIVLVGGQGTRLRPLTIRTAKPLLPTAGRPFLVHALARLREAGITRVLLATSYQADTFAAELGDGSALGLSLEYVVEEKALGTGGAIRNAGQKLSGGPDDPVVILNGDILSGADLGAQLHLHDNADAEVTLHLTEVADARAFGSVPTDDSGRVTAFLEKMARPPTNSINAGCYIFRRRVIDAIAPGQVVSVERETFPGLLADGAYVAGFLDDTYWLDVGTPAAYVRGSRDLVLGTAPSTSVPERRGEAVVLPGAELATTAVVRGGATVGARSRIGAHAVIDGSVLMDDVVVEDGAIVRDCAIGRGARIGARCELTGVVVGDGAEVGADNELVSGARLWVDAQLPAGSVRFSSDS